MKTIYNWCLILLCFSLLLACQSIPSKLSSFPKMVYKSEDLSVVQIAPSTYVHTSYLSTQKWGKVPCNGMIVKNKNEVIVLDTPANEVSSEALINWIGNELKAKIKWVVPTHFHDDNLGGLSTFHKHSILSIAYYKTQELAKNRKQPQAKLSFSNTNRGWDLGGEQIFISYYGKGHTEDNLVVYYPKDKVLFGGCLVKELGAEKGNLADAFPKEWSMTIDRVKKAYPKVEIVIPGHGKVGGTELLDYTEKLFKSE